MEIIKKLQLTDFYNEYLGSNLQNLPHNYRHPASYFRPQLTF